ncbi:unnamed protein product [Notodromas monacha]|uniref:Uncharacterized protein n=1 Tax=Notodromas monacha TaxID=399045 RepID=A0A7R9GG93_9CRUS|nr:unnamed protein product [Notodromas monacha]CAG0921468.1 unnamed protein product [Notodromas monacha]
MRSNPRKFASSRQSSSLLLLLLLVVLASVDGKSTVSTTPKSLKVDPKDDARPLCELHDGRSTCKCRPGLTEITIGGSPGRENIRVGNRTVEMRIKNCTSIHILANGFEAAKKLRSLHFVNVDKLVLEPYSFAFPRIGTDETPAEKTEGRTMRFISVDSDAFPQNTFTSEFRRIDLVNSSIKTWQTGAIGPGANVSTLHLDSTSVGVWERDGIDTQATLENLDFQRAAIDTMETEAIRISSSPVRDVTIFGCTFRILNSRSFAFQALRRLRFTNNTMTGSVSTHYIEAHLTGPEMIFRNNRFAKLQQHAFKGITSSNSTTLRFLGNTLTACDEECLSFSPTVAVNASETKFNTSCDGGTLKFDMISFAPELAKDIWATGKCFKDNEFVSLVEHCAPEPEPKPENTSFVTYVIPIITTSSVLAVIFAGAVAGYVCCGGRQRFGRGPARRTRSGVVLTDSWNFGPTDSCQSSNTEVDRSSTKSEISTYPRYVFPVTTEIRAYPASAAVENTSVPTERISAYEPRVEIYGVPESEYANAAPPLPPLNPTMRRMDTFPSNYSR